MEQYINKSAVVAEIENIEADAICQYKSDKSRYAEGGLDVIHRIKHLLDTLEAKEVDLKKEYEKYYEQERYIQTFKLAKYFFELGLKAQKGE